MNRKLIGIFVCMLFVGTVLPVTGNVITYKNTLSSTNGNILYVGGTGEGNYTKIQDAIDDAVDGDTVYVYDDSSPYYENLTINKGITLLGEDKETTIIDGLKLTYNIISISADWVTISGFTIQNCNGDYLNGAIRINGDYITISGNIIKDNNNISSNGIRFVERLAKHKYNTISNNIFINNFVGILIEDIIHTTIKNNKFTNHVNGILPEYICYNTTIMGNLIDECKISGIEINGNNNIISGNTISNVTRASHARAVDVTGKNNQIINNNFFNNRRNAICLTLPWKNLWNGNYWDDWIGFKYLQLDFLPYFERFLFWFIIDWHPAQEPHDIEGFV